MTEVHAVKTVCPQCGHYKHKCSRCGHVFDDSSPVTSAHDQSDLGNAPDAHPSLVDAVPTAHEPVTMVRRTSSGGLCINTVKNLTLSQHHTTIQLDSKTPVTIHKVADAAELSAASDGVMIMRTDWSQATTLGDGSTQDSAPTTQKSVHQSKEREFIITELVDNLSEDVFAEVIEVIQSTDLPEKVVKDLYSSFHVRLLGLTKRLEFIMDVEKEKLDDVLRLEPKVLETLAELVPSHRRQTVTWKSFSHLPVQCSDLQPSEDEDLREPVIEISETDTDPMTATPHRAFSFTPSLRQDTKRPHITSIIMTKDNRLFMADNKNNMIKIADLTYPLTVSAPVKLSESPWCLALLPDDLVAVTTGKRVIYLLTTGEEVRTVAPPICTTREYCGVASNVDDSLIVSCAKSKNSPACVDIINRGGHLVKTIAQSGGLVWPSYLCVESDHVFVSDYMGNAVYTLDMATGKTVDTLKYVDLQGPRQVVIDRAGNMYVASSSSKCVLVMSKEKKWRKLLDAAQHSEEDYKFPWAVCLASRRMLVAWCRVSSDGCSVIDYDLK